MHASLQYLQTLGLIFRYGKLSRSGIDFNTERSKSLSKIIEIGIDPQGFNHNTYSQINKSASPNSVIRNVIGQLAFIKSSLKVTGGHINAPALNLSYIRIPKAASTSVSAMILNSTFPKLQNIPLSSADVNYLTDAMLLSEVDTQYTYFTIVRDPFARIVSVYRDFFERSGKYFLYEDYLFGILKRDLTFKQFVERITTIPDLLKDQHFKPQHMFLRFYDKRNIPVKIFKLEEVENLNNFLTTSGLSLPELNKSPQQYDYRDYYDQKTIRSVASLYRDDLRLFGYQFLNSK